MSLGSLALLSIKEKPLGLEIQFLANSMFQLDISDSRCDLAYRQFLSSLLDSFCGCQLKDEPLVAFRYRVLVGDCCQSTLDRDGVLRFAGPMFVLRGWDMIQMILSKSISLLTLLIWA